MIKQVNYLRLFGKLIQFAKNLHFLVILTMNRGVFWLQFLFRGSVLNCFLSLVASLDEGHPLHLLVMLYLFDTLGHGHLPNALLFLLDAVKVLLWSAN